MKSDPCRGPEQEGWWGQLILEWGLEHESTAAGPDAQGGRMVSSGPL